TRRLSPDGRQPRGRADWGSNGMRSCGRSTPPPPPPRSLARHPLRPPADVPLRSAPRGSGASAQPARSAHSPLTPSRWYRSFFMGLRSHEAGRKEGTPMSLIPIVRNAGEGDRQSFAGGGLHLWKLLAEDTDGAFFLFEDTMVRDKTTPLHLHPEAH